MASNKFISLIDGFKTATGIILHTLWFCYYVFFNDTIDKEIQLRGHGLIFILTGVGLFHKGVKFFKSEKGKSIINKIKK